MWTVAADRHLSECSSSCEYVAMCVLIDGGAVKSFEVSRQDSDTSCMSISRGDFDHRRRVTQHQLPVSGSAGTAGVVGGPAGATAPRRQVAIRQLGSGRRQRAARPPSVCGGLSPNQIQLISLPQLDLVQRSLKILDVRVQRLHAVALEEDKVGLRTDGRAALSQTRTKYHLQMVNK